MTTTPGSQYADDWIQLLAGVDRNNPLTGLGVAPGDRVLFVGAHPDDETYGAGATLAALARLGVATHVVSLSSGEAAFDHVGISVPSLGEQRRAEFVAACGELGVLSSSVLDLPDGGLADRAADIDRALDDRVRSTRPTKLLAVWWDDPHPDHRAAGLAALRLGERRGISVTGFPIWAQHWSHPSDFQIRGSIDLMATDAYDRASRDRASARYLSQTTSVAPGIEPVLPPWFLSWDAEIAFGR